MRGPSVCLASTHHFVYLFWLRSLQLEAYGVAGPWAFTYAQ